MSKVKKEEKTKIEQNALIKECVDQYDRDFDALSTVRSTWDEKEALIVGDLLDGESSTNSKSKVNSPDLQTAVLKRTNNTIAQLPTGKVQALSKKDAGKNIAMNMILQKYVLPNAKTGHDIYTKSWMMEFYSLVYGTENVLVDYVVSDRYVGPDFYLLNQRDFVPQRGRISVDNCDRVFVRSKVSRKWLLDRDTKNWKNIDSLLDKVKGSRATGDSDRQSYVERRDNATALAVDEKDGSEDIEIITRYEPDRWITFSRDGNLLLRDIKNPQQNDELPIVSKHAFPLKDRFHGLGEFERGMTLQYALNSLINLYLSGVEMSIFPPLKIYLPDVVASTIQNEAGAKWVLKNMNPNAIMEFNRSPQGINSFQSTYSFLKGALLSTMGTTDTSIPQNVDPGMGKTPQALKMQAAMDDSRTNFDRKMLEQSMEKIFEKFIDLISTRQEKPIKMHLMKEDLELIAQYNPDVVEMFESGKYGQVVIKPSDINNTKYKFFIDAGTTTKKDDAVENESLKEIMGMVMNIPGAPEQIAQTGKVILGNKSIDIAETFKRIVITQGVQDWEKIVTDISPEEQQAAEMLKQPPQPPAPPTDPSMMPQDPSMQPPMMPQMPPMQQMPPMMGAPQAAPMMPSNPDEDEINALMGELTAQR